MITAKEAKENSEMELHNALSKQITIACKNGLTKTSIESNDVVLLRDLLKVMEKLGYDCCIQSCHGNRNFLDVNWS